MAQMRNPAPPSAGPCKRAATPTVRWRKIERALSMSPNLAIAHGHRGATLIFAGRPREGLAALEICIRLDPRDPYLAVRLLHVACGLYFCSEYEASIEAAKRLIRSFPRFSDDLPLARGGAGPTRAHNGSEGSIGEGRLARTSGHSTCMSARELRGFVPRTTLISSRVCARLAGMVEAALKFVAVLRSGRPVIYRQRSETVKAAPAQLLLARSRRKLSTSVRWRKADIGLAADVGYVPDSEVG